MPSVIGGFPQTYLSFLARSSVLSGYICNDVTGITQPEAVFRRSETFDKPFLWGADTASEPKSVRHLQGPFRTLTHDLPDALVKPGFRFRFADVERTWTRTGEYPKKQIGNLHIKQGHLRSALCRVAVGIPRKHDYR